jgi:hypothetical protein
VSPRAGWGAIRDRLTGPGRPWLLHLFEVPGVEPLRLAIAVAVVFTPINYITGKPIATPLILAYTLGISGYLIDRQKAELDALSPVLDGDSAARVWVRDRLGQHPRYLLWMAWLLGPLLTFIVNYDGAGVTALRLGQPIDPVTAWGLVLPVIFWVVFVQMMVIFLRNAWTFHRLGREAVRVNLLDVESLAPLGRVAVRNLLIFVGGYALTPLTLIDSPTAMDAVAIGMAITSPFSVALLLLPVYAVHQRLVREKAAELERLRLAIRGDRSALAGSPIDVDAESIPLSNLVLYRETIAQVKEWPVNTPVLLRFGAYVVIPVLAWIAAAVVERWVDALL